MPENEVQLKENSEQKEKEYKPVVLSNENVEEASELSDEEMDEVSGGIIIIGGIRKGGKD